MNSIGVCDDDDHGSMKVEIRLNAFVSKVKLMMGRGMRGGLSKP